MKKQEGTEVERVFIDGVELILTEYSYENDNDGVSILVGNVPVNGAGFNLLGILGEDGKVVRS